MKAVDYFIRLTLAISSAIFPWLALAAAIAGIWTGDGRWGMTAIILIICQLLSIAIILRVALKERESK